MRTVLGIYRAIRLGLTLYGLWAAFLRGRWLTIVLAIWRLLRRRELRPVVATAELRFVDGSEPAIYRRAGWRKLVLRRIRNTG